MERIAYYVSAIHERRKRASDETSGVLIQLCGKDGLGKTTIARAYASGYNASYFSFRHMESSVALQAFMPGCPDWDSFFAKMKRKNKRPIIVFDDWDDRNDKDDFLAALYRYLTHGATAVMVGRKYFRFPISCEPMELTKMAACDVVDCFPRLSPWDALRLTVLTEGLPPLVNAYQEGLSFEENVRRFFSEGSAFLEYAPAWLRQEFRSPESYNTLLQAMATGHNRISEIAAVTGYPKNKCDKYIKALMEAGFVKAVKQVDGSGQSRTLYRPASAYLKLWYGIYLPNRPRFWPAPGRALCNTILAQLQGCSLEAYRDACFRWIKDHAWEICYTPLQVNDPKLRQVTVGGFPFDFVQKVGELTIFASIWDDIETPFPAERFQQIDDASCTVSPFYNNIYLLFSIQRFPDALERLTAQFENVHSVYLRFLVGKRNEEKHRW